MLAKGLVPMEDLRIPTTTGGCRPKGLLPGRKFYQNTLRGRIIETAQQIVSTDYEDHLPIGPRAIAYLLLNVYGVIEGKEQFDHVTRALVVARQAGLIPWSAISDGRTTHEGPAVFDDAAEAASAFADGINEIQFGRLNEQSVRVEIWSEVQESLPRIARIAAPWGVSVYSGSGSCPVEGCRQAALRAVQAWEDYGQSTTLLDIGDLDLNGIRNIAVPRGEQVDAFARDYGYGGDDIEYYRILITPEQVETHVPENSRVAAPASFVKAGWPYPWRVDAEAIAPDIFDSLIKGSLGHLLDSDVRDAAIAADKKLRGETCSELVDRFTHEDT